VAPRRENPKRTSPKLTGTTSSPTLADVLSLRGTCSLHGAGLSAGQDVSRFRPTFFRIFLARTIEGDGQRVRPFSWRLEASSWPGGGGRRRFGFRPSYIFDKNLGTNVPPAYSVNDGGARTRLHICA
jgi:hypothetical protein